MGDLDMNLPGMSTTHVKVKLPVCKSIFKDEYHIHITGKTPAEEQHIHLSHASVPKLIKEQKELKTSRRLDLTCF